MSYTLSLADQNPALLRPAGDRYLVALIETDDTVQIGETTLVIARPLRRDDKGREIPGSDTEDIGWKVGVVVSAGDGLMLDQPCSIVTMADATPEAEIAQMRAGKKSSPPGALYITQQAVSIAHPPLVPMQYRPGDVLFIERFAGRTILLAGKPYCIISQVHVLLRHPTLYLEPDAENGWREAERKPTPSLAAV